MLNPILEEFSHLIGDADEIDLRFRVEMDASSEEIAFDNIRVTGQFAAVPEPASMAMMSLLAIGGGGFVWRKRRKAKKDQAEKSETENADVS